MNKKLLLVVALLLSVALIFTACKKDNDTPATTSNDVTDNNDDQDQTDDQTDDQSDNETEDKDDHDHDDHDHEHSEAADIMDWEGTWNNMGAYLDNEELQGAFETLAENEGVSVEEAKDAYKEKRMCEFDGLKIEDGKVTFLDGFDADGGKEIETVEYEFVESVKTMHGNYELQWDVFEAKGDAKYKVLLMMPVHGEESLTHFHMRYGNDKDELMQKDGWYPTFVKPSTTNEQLIEEITE